MRIIAELAKYLRDEAKSARKYTEMAIKYKHTNKDLAEMFIGMAKTEKGHIDNIHVWLVKFIDKERKERLQPVPQGMMDVWEWEHQQMVEEAEELELLINNYQKM